MRHFAFSLLGTIGGYVLAAVAGSRLIYLDSSQDGPVEAAMTGAFMSAPRRGRGRDHQVHDREAVRLGIRPAARHDVPKFRVSRHLPCPASPSPLDDLGRPSALLIANARITLAFLLLAGSIATLLKRYRRRWAVPFFVTLALLPAVPWLVLMGYPSDGSRWTWIKLWPVLPGLPAGFFFHPNDPVDFFVSGSRRSVSSFC